MTKGELLELIEGYHSEDEVVFLSPGDKPLIVAGINFEETNKTGKVCIRTEWYREGGKPLTEVERLKIENEKLNTQLQKAQRKGKRGRPKKTDK